MNAEEYLNKHIEETNIPKDFYYYEIAQLMEDYAQDFAQQQNEKSQSSEVEPYRYNEQEDTSELAKEIFQDKINEIKSTNQDRVREAAEKVVDYALYGGLGVNLHDAIVELEKALNQNK